MIKDGRTILIGGLFRESSTSSRAQVPFMGNLPWIGNLFRQQHDQTTREEIIILLTPHIVKDDVAYSDASLAELKIADKLRVGVRKGMMWWGRERLAESDYERAVHEMSKPRPSRKKALWYLDSATNLNPKFLEAIEMKQSLTGKEVTDVDNSSIRGFLRREMLMERVPPATMPTAMNERQLSEPFSPIDPEQMANDELALAPTTAPTTEPSIADVPSTEPSISAAPSTQPAVAAAPTTQPTKVSELLIEEVLPPASPEDEND